MSLIDTHSHIDMADFDDLDAVIENAKSFGVEKIVLPSVERSSFENVIKIANKYDCVYGALGIHPTEAQEVKDEDYQKIEQLILQSRLGIPAQQQKIVAIGECGLDYYWDKTYVEEQKKCFP